MFYHCSPLRTFLPPFNFFTHVSQIVPTANIAVLENHWSRQKYFPQASHLTLCRICRNAPPVTFFRSAFSTFSQRLRAFRAGKSHARVEARPHPEESNGRIVLSRQLSPATAHRHLFSAGDDVVGERGGFFQFERSRIRPDRDFQRRRASRPAGSH